MSKLLSDERLKVIRECLAFDVSGFGLIRDLFDHITALQSQLEEANNGMALHRESYLSIAKLYECLYARFLELRCVSEQLLQDAKAVLDAESDYNIEQNERAGCAPGTMLVSGRWTTNRAMREMCNSGEAMEKLLSDDLL